MKQPFRYRVRDPLAGILSDWFGLKNCDAMVLKAIYERPGTKHDLAKRLFMPANTIGYHVSCLRQVGLDIPKGHKSQPAITYRLTESARLEVQKAYAHAFEQLGGLLPDLDEHQALRDALGITWESPPEWKLGPMEARFVGVLMKTKIAHRDRLMGALYADRSDPPHQKIIDVMACKLRRKLKPYGIDIRSKWGVGYYLAERDAA